MKPKRTLILAILFLTTLACGLAWARTESGLECVSFCSVALCPEGTTCGPSPGGGCGCQPNGGILEAGS